ncbi:bZIP transcription factor 11-like [Impatiens glandulifera]|uniref:bZIP transcription factor 11-like n=1 Tax=Impatiens glandulifera TaxID=253017 RepID=UPI001FB04FB0|nr:bZIP transcription factor 11-like [Impatiens glandulifera]
MASSGSSAHISVSGSDEDQLRQKKRKISNRESAKRSRMRKQQHLDELMDQVSRLNKENACVLTNLNVTRQMCLKVEAENSVLQAQVTELTHWLISLKRIIGNSNNDMVDLDEQMMMMMNGDDFFNMWN